MDAFTKLAAMSALLSTAASLRAQSNELYVFVDPTAPAGGDGRSFESAYNDLGEACRAANKFAQEASARSGWASVSVRLARGVYRPTRDRSGALNAFEINADHASPVSAVALVSGLSFSLVGGLAGRGAPDPYAYDPAAYVSVVSADVNGDDRPGFVNREDNAQTAMAVYARAGSFTFVSGVTFEGGHAQPRPGAVEQASGGLYVSDLHQDNWPSIRVIDCVFRENEGQEGGGLKVGSAFVRGCRFENNRAVVGGGLWGTDVDMADCVVAHNAATLGGGLAGDGRVTRVSFRENHARLRGGAYYITAASSGYRRELSYCLFAGNSAAGTGGAVCVAPDAAPNSYGASRCTFTQNSAANGGAIWAGLFNAYACIFWKNSAAERGIDVYSTPVPLVVLPVSATSCLLNTSAANVWIPPGAFGGGSRLIAGDPEFADAAGPDGNPMTTDDNDYRLTAHSPCVDAVWTYWEDDNDGGGTDLAGLRALEPGYGSEIRAPDIGCYEWRSDCPADFDHSGGSPDASDLTAFLQAFSARSKDADIDGSGWVSDDDLDRFIQLWLAGGC